MPKHGRRDVALTRANNRTFGDCNHCTVHCYGTSPREQIRAVMRWAAPRMLLLHPPLTIRHLFDGRRSAPGLPCKQARKGSGTSELE